MDFRKITKQTETIRKRSYFYKYIHTHTHMGFPRSTSGKERACQFGSYKEVWVQSLGPEDPLEEGIATHSSILAWRIPMDRGDWWAAV